MPWCSRQRLSFLYDGRGGSASEPARTSRAKQEMKGESFSLPGNGEQGGETSSAETRRSKKGRPKATRVSTDAVYMDEDSPLGRMETSLPCAGGLRFGAGQTTGEGKEERRVLSHAMREKERRKRRERGYAESLLLGGIERVEQGEGDEKEQRRRLGE